MGLRGPPKRLPQGKTSYVSGYTSGAPSPPSWLCDEAHEEWVRIVPEIEKAGVLKLVDRAALVAYCQAWAELVIATRQIEDEGRTVTEPIQNSRGETIGEKTKAHPAVKLQRDAFSRVKSFLVEFGFSPNSRARIGGDGGLQETPKNRLEKIRKQVEQARDGDGDNTSDGD
jgi:P27 family predicted phage terminase small subunit